MIGVSVKITGTIVSMLIVFLIFLWALFIVLGSPQCDDMANSTAYSFKYAIDQVSTEDVPLTPWGDNPDSTQYRTATIRLCQEDYLYSKLSSPLGSPGANVGDQVYSWVLKLFGGEPQYKIYYEIFPEGGGGMWKESYPWNGGAASTFLFWGIMRGVSFGVEYLSPLVIGAKSSWSIFKWLKGVDQVSTAVTSSGSIFSRIYGQPFMLGQLMTQALGSPFIIFSGVGNLNISNKSAIFFDSDRRDAFGATRLLNEKFSEAIIKGLRDSGFIRKNPDGTLMKVGARIAINNGELPIIFNAKEISNDNWKITEYGLAVKQTASGNFDPTNVDWNDVKNIDVMKDADGNYDMFAMEQSVPSGYVLLTYKPNNLVRDVYNELVKSDDQYDKERSEELKKYWYWDEDSSSGERFDIDVADNSFLQTAYAYEIYNRGVENFNNRIKNFKNQGVLTKDTVLHSGDITLVLEGFREAAFAGDSDSDNIREAFLAILGDLNGPGNIGNGVYDRICNALNKETPCVVSYDDMFDALQSDLASTKKTGLYHPEVGTGGILMLWNDSGINVDVKIMDMFMLGTDCSNPFLLSEVNAINKVGYSDAEIINICNGQKTWLNDPGGGDYLNKHDISVLPKGMGKLYLKRWANALKQIPKGGAVPEQSEWAVTDIGFIIGLYRQESGLEQITVPERYQGSITASAFGNNTRISFQGRLIWELVKRPLFWNVEQLITPSSGIAKGFLLSSTEGCLGNSLCVYSHGAIMNPEKPFYLNESAKAYFIRIWRPVSPLMNVAGVEGFLKQVPSHPRFHVVSPCFGTAKIWKTDYNGKKTIFVKIDKFNLSDTASNYCYADEGLIHTYGAIWFLSTVGQVVESVASWYLGGMAKDSVAATLGKTVLDKVDPVLLAQAFAEAYISWPGPPHKSLNVSTMNAGNSMLIDPTKETK